jgi:hypothetical protein
MLHVFYLDVAKVDRHVAHVAMIIHVRCKCMLQMFQLFLDVCCKCMFSKCYSCFRRMSQVFYPNVASVSFGCCKIRSEFAYITMIILLCFKRILHMLQG